MLKSELYNIFLSARKNRDGIFIDILFRRVILEDLLVNAVILVTF